ncbi:MAG TPA: serine hydrolase domain-containing protein [Planctomycetota bacterium]
MRMRRFPLLFLPVFFAAAAVAQEPAVQAPAVAEARSLEARLERLVETLEAKRVEHHIPGMALVVVQGDRAVLARGFGVVDLESETPVTAQTPLPIGSASKAFTVAAIGMLVDEGRMELDAPITDYLPYFELPIDAEVGTEVSLRDLLCHRTGFTRMQILAAANYLDPGTILHAAVHAEPWAPFRERFLYSNVAFLAAGTAAGQVAGSDWQTLVEERIFAPLGMRASVTTVADLPAGAPRMGYLWNEKKQEFEDQPLRQIDNIAPAGAVIATADDMAQWLRFQLGGGVFQGERLLSAAQHAASWEVQTEIAPGAGYGLGWMIREGGAQRVVEHGGNVQGFCAQVGLFPDADLGFALMMNVSASILQQESIRLVQAVLLEDSRPGDAPLRTQDLEPYVGTYIANFASFSDAPFEVLIKDGRLAVDVPGQTTYELKNPDAEGKWEFALTDQVAVSFERDAHDRPKVLRFHQGGLVFEVPREGVSFEPEIPLDELERYLGAYQCAEPAITASVVIRNNRLAVDWPGEMVYELHPPDAEGTWVFRVTDRFRLRFDEDGSGRVAGLTYNQGERVLVFERGAVAAEAAVPSLDEILVARDTAGRKAALAALGSVAMTGTVRYPQSGVGGALSLRFAGPGQLREDQDLGAFGWLRLAADGESGGFDASFAPFEVLKGSDLERVRSDHPGVLAGDWRDWFDAITVLKAGTHEGRPTWVLKMQRDDGDPNTVTVDAGSGDVLKVDLLQSIPSVGGSLPITVIFEDYRDVAGVRLPFRVTSRNEMSGLTIKQFESVTTALAAQADRFVLRAGPRPEAWQARRR